MGRYDGLVFGPGPAGRCDDFRVGGAVVDRDGVSGLWRMWYFCRDHAFDPAAPPTLAIGRIALATSRDGIDWTRVDGPLTGGAVLEPSIDPADFDSLIVGLTDVTRGAGEWLMWTLGGDHVPRVCTAPGVGTHKGLGLRPGLARSQDGVHWCKVRGSSKSGALFDPPPGALYAAWPNVFHDGRRYVMHYTAPAPDLGHFPTLVATSDDALRWTQHGALVWADGDRAYDAGGLVTRQVLANPLPGGRRWLMIYTATDAAHARAIGAADSDDGIAWHHLSDEPIFGVGAADAWDSFGVAATRLVPCGERLFLYYYGFRSLAADRQLRAIGLAISERGLGGFVRIPRDDDAIAKLLVTPAN